MDVTPRGGITPKNQQKKVDIKPKKQEIKIEEMSESLSNYQSQEDFDDTKSIFVRKT